MFDSSVVDDLAAILYGCSPDLAVQVLLTNQIESALNADGSSTLSELATRAGFFEALEFINFFERSNDGAVGLSRAVAKLQSASILETEAGTEWFNSVITQLAVSTSRWLLADEESGFGVAVIFARAASTDPQLQQLLSNVSPTGPDGDANGLKHMGGVAGLAKGLDQFERVIEDFPIAVHITSANFVPCLSSLRAQVESSSILRIFNFQSDEKNAFLIGAAIRIDSPDARSAFELLSIRPGQFNPQDLTKNLLDWMFELDLQSSSQAALIFQILDEFSKEPSENIREFCDNGTFMNALQVAVQNGFWDEAAAASFLQLMFYPSLPEPGALRASQSGTAILRQVLNDPASQQELFQAQNRWLAAHPTIRELRLFELASVGGYKAWATAQLQALASAGYLHLTASQLLMNLKLIQSALNDASVTFLVRELLNDPLENQSIVESGNPQAIALAIRSGSADGVDFDPTPFIEAAIPILIGQTKDTWSSLLNTPSPVVPTLIELAIATSRSGNVIDPPTALYDALHNHSKALAIGADVWTSDAKSFNDLVEAIGTDSSEILARQIAGFLENRDGDMGAGFLPTYGDFLREQKSFRTHEGLPTAISILVATGSWTNIGWFVDLSKAFPDVFESTGREAAIEHLKSTVKTKLSELSDAIPQQLGELAQVLGVDLSNANGEGSKSGPETEK